MICPLTDISLFKDCPVTTCMWHAISAKHKCIAPTGDNTKSETRIALLKGVDPEEYRAQANRGVRRIERIIVLNAFLDWLQQQNLGKDISVDLELIDYLKGNVMCIYPFDVKLLRWNPKNIILSLSYSVWNSFFKQHSGVRKEPHLRILGISRKKAREIVSEYKRTRWRGETWQK